MKVAGLTAVQTYIEWSSHEAEPAVYTFSDNLDIELYLQTAAHLGLGNLVLVTEKINFSPLPFSI